MQLILFNLSESATNPFNFCILIVSLNLTYLLQYLAEQIKQPVCNLPRQAPAVPALE